MMQQRSGERRMRKEPDSERTEIAVIYNGREWYGNPAALHLATAQVSQINFRYATAA